ncbi:ABC transporter ATP-binding protein [Ethanoligenens sp.]|uniref:ABC transporter ATP-binding protein n=1 Tax=Ethanoligenens sp. TaxID=2099655 RepID=UPI0039EBBDD5
MTELLKLDRVSRQLSGFALQEISFGLEPGYIMGLIGPNGSGKTTTIKLIMNMFQRNSGSIWVNGLDNLQDEMNVKQCIGYVSDENIFAEDWTADNVGKGLSIYFNTFDLSTYRSYLKRFELPRRKKIKTFSRGMKTRLMLAAALSRQTKLLVLDEPTSGLDPVVRTELLNILQEYIADGAHSVLFSTHITTDLEKVADYITFICKGRQMFTQNKDELMEAYQIIRGAPEDLDTVLRHSLIGLRENHMGFEALAKIEALPACLPAGLIRERPTLDDIVVYHTMGVAQ